MVVVPRRWRRAGQAMLTVTALAALTLGSVGPAQAQAGCPVAQYQASSWSTDGDSGGFVAEITLTNGCGDPVSGWTLELALPSGHTLTHGWSAQWSSSGGLVSATDLPWSRTIDPGASIRIGFVGAWTGAYQDPLACSINGAPCAGAEERGNEPPTVTLTRPSSGLASYVPPCPFVLAAEASDPDGTVDRVEFYVNDVLVGTDDTAPYRVGIQLGASPSPSGQVAFARAYDDGTPPESGDSVPLTFGVVIGDPPPETLLGCGGPLEMAAGGSEEIRFALFSSVVDEVTLTVSGDPGVTVSPTTVVADGNAADATVTAAPGSAGSTATITATAGDLSPASISVTVLPPA